MALVAASYVAMFWALFDQTGSTWIFQSQDNVRFRQGTVSGVDWERKQLRLEDAEALGFDYLIVAAGAIYDDFGVPGVKQHAFFLKSLSEAVNIRSHVLRRFERAATHPETIDDGELTFVLVGGGPTGVELAGALAELFERVLPKDYPEVDVSRARIVLLEMADALLGPFSPGSREHAASVLRKRGVDVRTGTTVAEVRSDAVVLADGSEIPTRTTIWSAGVRGSPLVDALDVELGRGYRIRTLADLSLPERPWAFAAGDVAGTETSNGSAYPQVAQVAIQQGKTAARNIVRLEQGRPTANFAYADRGIMAIIGRNAGVAELSKRFGGFRLRGFLGWLGWLFIHLIYLPGHQNRFQALANWAYNYLTFDRHARLITDMEPSPGEIANRTGALVSPDESARVRDEPVRQRQRAQGADAGDEGPRPTGDAADRESSAGRPQGSGADGASAPEPEPEPDPGVDSERELEFA